MREKRVDTLTLSKIFFRPGVRRKATGGQTPPSGKQSQARCPGLRLPRSPTARRRTQLDKLCLQRFHRSEAGQGGVDRQRSGDATRWISKVTHSRPPP